MDQVSAENRLPETYSRAVRLRREGADEAAIAAQLGIQPQAVRALLRIAEAKLATLQAAPDRSPGSAKAEEP